MTVSVYYVLNSILASALLAAAIKIKYPKSSIRRLVFTFCGSLSGWCIKALNDPIKNPSIDIATVAALLLFALVMSRYSDRTDNKK